MVDLDIKCFEILDQPTTASVEMLRVALREDCARRSVSAKNHAHRSRVIRQQANLLQQKQQLDALESHQQDAKRLRKAARPADHRDQGGES